MHDYQYGLPAPNAGSVTHWAMTMPEGFPPTNMCFGMPVFLMAMRSAGMQPVGASRYHHLEERHEEDLDCCDRGAGRVRAEA